MSAQLEGRVIAVAGAGGALGPAVVDALTHAGAQVAACDANDDALARLDAAHACVADLGSDHGAAQWADAVRGELGQVHGLIHLVGGWRGGSPLDEAPLEDLDLLHTLLFRTVVHTTRAFAPDLRAAGERGRFALVSAAQAQQPSAGNAAYAAMKAAAEAWTLAFAAELKELNATANVVVVNALVTQAMRDANPDKTYRTFTDVEEVADALVFLCSDSARKMSGRRLALHAS
jgi:NAD(P)-dependent dehydrogenase (short-subunit alcohol dehydrogenase family)